MPDFGLYEEEEDGYDETFLALSEDTAAPPFLLFVSSEDESSSSSSWPSWNVGFFVGEGSAGVLPLALAWRAVIAGEFIMSFKFMFCEVVTLWLDAERRRGRLPRDA